MKAAKRVRYNYLLIGISIGLTLSILILNIILWN